jgi:hypothetical protein
MKNNPLRIAAICLGLAAIAACHAAPEPPKALFRNAKVPAGSTIATTRAVDVTISADSSLFPHGKIGGIQVSRPNGTVVFRGAMVPSRAVKFRVAMPFGMNEMLASMTGPDGKITSVHMPIGSSNTAAWSFQ